MRLILDAETTGLPIKKAADDDERQPHLLQIGLMLLDPDWAEVATVSMMVLPDGWEVPDDLIRVHGISTDRALLCGVPVLTVLSVYTNLRARADEIVAHNAPFDIRMMAIELARSGRAPAHPGPALVSCTQELSRPILKLPPTPAMVRAGMADHYKSPSLKEAHMHFFGEPVPGAHDALSDARACARVYRKILEGSSR